MTNITYELLSDNAELLDTCLEGTVQLWIYQGKKYTVLCDNSVIEGDTDFIEMAENDE